MPFRLSGQWTGTRAKIQFTTAAWMPSAIYRACLATGTLSGTVYCQRALVAALARDLDLDEDDLLSGLPTPRGPAAHLWPPDVALGRRPVTVDQSGGTLMTGPANTVEEVR